MLNTHYSVSPLFESDLYFSLFQCVLIQVHQETDAKMELDVQEVYWGEEAGRSGENLQSVAQVWHLWRERRKKNWGKTGIAARFQERLMARPQAKVTLWRSLLSCQNDPALVPHHSQSLAGSDLEKVWPWYEHVGGSSGTFVGH